VDKEAPAPAGTEGLVQELADPAFGQGLEEASPGAEEAMEALEAAMEEAETRSKAAAASLGTESPPQHPPSGEPETVSERLQKFLARAGVASRRHAEVLITAGRVSVNNQRVTELGSKVEPSDLVMVDGQLVTVPEHTSWYLLHKHPAS
jgi:ribosome-associated protein YbcJ (S4-like RNA binding protein)